MSNYTTTNEYERVFEVLVREAVAAALAELRTLCVAVGDYLWAVSPRDATGRCRLCDATEGLIHDPAKECGRLAAAYLAAIARLEEPRV